MNFYISDTHFGHQNIIRYDNRPFSTADEMDEALIDRWNDVVSDEDTEPISHETANRLSGA